MRHRLSLIESDVTAHPNHFVLTLDGNLLVRFALRIKPTQRCSIHRANGGEMRAGNVILLCKLEQSGKRLVSLVEDNGVLFRWFSRVQQLNFHPGSFAFGPASGGAIYSLAVSCEYAAMTAIPPNNSG